MVHNKRIFCVKAVDSLNELVEKLTQHSWTLCTGFRHGNFLLLNDAFSEDGAQEYAVIAFIAEWPTEGTGTIDGHQIESITVSWCTPALLREILVKVMIDPHSYLDHVLDIPVLARIEAPAVHHCRLCA